MTAIIEIFVNGEARTVAEGTRLGAYLASLGLKPGDIAVEHNKQVAPKRCWDEIELRPQDRLEIVHFVGGG
jgi:thiamine biosynthesis protein ThiS